MRLRISIIGTVAVAAAAFLPGAAAQASAASSSGAATTPFTITATTHGSTRRIQLPGGGTAYARVNMRLAPAPTTENLPAEVGRTAADDTYATGEATICNNSECTNWETEVAWAVTYSSTNIWINGNPQCFKSGTYITWCGYGDNGQPTIGIGDNFGNSGQYKFRIYINAPEKNCNLSYPIGTAVGVLCP